MDILYFDTVIASGRIRDDLRPAAEMAAVRSIEAAEKAGLNKITTARITFEEQDRTKDLAVREQLKHERSRVDVLTGDHRVVGLHNQGDQAGGFISYPFVTDIVEEPLFVALKAAGLHDLDARHLLYAIHNGCHWFVTLDPHFLNRKLQLEAVARGLKISKPSDLVAALGLGAIAVPVDSFQQRGEVESEKDVGVALRKREQRRRSRAL